MNQGCLSSRIHAQNNRGGLGRAKTQGEEMPYMHNYYIHVYDGTGS